MTLVTIVILFAAAVASGVINAVAGGGTFITFGVLTLFGMPPITANASSAIIQFPGYVTSTHAYRAEISRYWRQALMLLAVSAVKPFCPSRRQSISWVGRSSSTTRTLRVVGAPTPDLVGGPGPYLSTDSACSISWQSWTAS